MQYLPFVCFALIQTIVNDKRQAYINPDLKGCLSCLCHPSTIFVCVRDYVSEREREKERVRAFGFWYVLEDREEIVIW